MASSAKERDVETRNAFNTFDKTNSGSIKVAEVNLAMKSLGLTPAEIQAILAGAGEDMADGSSSLVTFAQFQSLVAKGDAQQAGSKNNNNNKQTKPASSKAVSDSDSEDDEDEGAADCDIDEKDLKRAFKEFDADGNGTISKEELGKVMESLGEQLTDQELQDMIADVDTDGDGNVDYKEFKKMLSIR